MGKRACLRAALLNQTGKYGQVRHFECVDRLAVGGRRVEELLREAEQYAVDTSRITKELVLGLFLHQAMNSKSETARVQATKCLGQSHFVALFVSEDENRNPKTAPELIRDFCGTIVNLKPSVCPPRPPSSTSIPPSRKR